MSREDALVGRVLDEKYRIEERLRRGGMGAVYLATHVGTSRPVALKVIAPELMRDPAVVERFKREARAAGQIRHPNVVNVTDFGFTVAGEERYAYLVMEHLCGLTLAELLEEQPHQPLARVVDILQQICAAVEEAHRHGVVHRDLKPENIWLERRPRGGHHVKVLDFGVAKLCDEHAEEIPPGEGPPPDAPPREVDPSSPTLAEPSSDPHLGTLTSTLQEGTSPSSGDLGVSPPPTSGARPGRSLAEPPSSGERAVKAAVEEGLTRYGVLLGTPLYMPPEQWLHRAVDARSDVYSLGVIAYQMLAGEVPFNGRASSIGMQHCRAPPAPLSQVAPGVPLAVATAVMAALSKDPAGRPPSAQSFGTALGAGAEGTDSTLRRAVVLCATHFSTLLRLNAMVFAPAAAACGLRLVNRIGVEAGLVPERAGAVIAAVALVGYLLGMAILQAVAAALFAPRVRTLLVDPSAEPAPPPTLAEVWICTRAVTTAMLSLIAVAVAMGWALRAPLLYLAQRAGLFTDELRPFTPIETAVYSLLEVPAFVVVSLVLGRYLAFPAVVSMEGLRGFAALRRAAVLTRPFRRAAAVVLGLHIGVRVLMLPIVRLLMAQIGQVSLMTLIDVAHDSIAANIGLLMTLCLQVVIWTLTTTAMAVVYLDGRQAEGVSLEAMPDPAAAPAAAAAARQEPPARRRTG